MNKPVPAAKAQNKKRVLLVDDHPLMRQGLGQLINQQSDLKVCAEAESAHEAIAAIEAHHPDIVVSDITLKHSNGIELIKDIRIRWPDLLVVVLTMHNETFYAERVLRAGARGFVTKGEAPTNVLVAIRAVLGGQIHLSEKLASQMIGKMMGNSPAAGGMLLDKLSDREFEVFEMLGQGVDARQIAQQLHLSVKTVETHRDNIRKKLGLDSSTDLLKYAMQWFQYESGS